MDLKADFLPGEEYIQGLGSDTLVLTNKRVRSSSFTGGTSGYLSITLDRVASCGLITKSKPLYLLLGIAACLAGASQLESSGFAGLTIIVGIALLCAFFITRRKFISIGSSGGEAISASVGSEKKETIIGFLNAIEKEKLK